MPLPVRTEDGDLQLLRFDCLEKGGHWHLDPMETIRIGPLAGK